MSELKHIGVKRRSGRYPWGSGKDGYQRNPSFRDRVNELKKQGLTESQIAEGMGFGKQGTSKLRAEISLEKAAQRKADSAFAQRLKDKGYSYTEIGKRMGKNESSIRSLLDPVMQEKALIVERTAEMLKNQVNEKKYLDVGRGIENQVGVTRTTLNTAIAELQKDGYKLQYVDTLQLGTGKKTTIKVLTKEDVPYKTLFKERDQIRAVTEWSNDRGRSWLGLEPPTNIDPSRIAIKYREDGGADMDGVIQLRRGAPDLSLGEAKYAQVRIAVGGTHFLKGMAIYSDDLPDGTDILFNTNKSKDVPVFGNKDNSVLKLLKDDPDNPFSSTVRQRNYIDTDGKSKLSPINIVYEEGSWENWSKTLSSQFLSKQSPSLAKQQLDIALKIRQDEFNEYNSLTNPTVKANLLKSFSDECDSDAVHLKAAAMPRQGSYVILPSPAIKSTEIYAPKYIDGDVVVLIRYPHAGPFEIPQLKVNNNDPKLKSLFGNAADAVVIHPDVAKKLSGADFDGDSVLVIPNKDKLISVPSSISSSLKNLQDFDPKLSYPMYEGMKRITEKNKQTEMGKISNLITDMTIKGASDDEIARAVRHSMVVIDAEKHNLNYKQSFIDNGISELKTIYQGGPTKGASTLLSRAKSQERIIPKRADNYKTDPITGKKIFISAPETYINKEGKVVERSTKSTKMYETDDAFELSSGTRMESIYAQYANSLKELGDKARLVALNTPPLEYSPSAKKVYQPEVESLLAQLSRAISNSPLERQAQLLANKVVSMKRDANPDLLPDDLKKIKGQALAEARYRVGAKKQEIQISPKEWEAIQAGAISNTVLKQILDNTNLDLVKQYATPRQTQIVSTAKLTRASVLLDRGYTQAEVARLLSITPSALAKALKEKGK